MFEIKEHNIHGFDLSSLRGNKGRTTCPFCSEDRTKSTEKCVTVDKAGEWFKCHHCGKKGKLHSYKKANEKIYKKPKPILNPPNKVEKWFKDRGIGKQTLKTLGITEGTHYFPQVQKNRSAICFNYYLEGELVNIKFRDGQKNFSFSAGAKLIPYNMDGIIGEDTAIIVEGEPDVAACIESDVHNVISVPNGAVKDGKNNLDYMTNVAEYLTHDKYILFVDDDAAGRNLREDLAAYLGKDKCYIIDDYRSEKDANAILEKFGNLIIPTIINEARPYPVDGIITLEDVYKEIEDVYENGIRAGETTNIGWLDPHFRWVRGWIYMFSGYPAHGKSTFLKWLLMEKAKQDGWRTAFFSPEDTDAKTFYIDLIEIYLKGSFDKTFHNRITKEQLYEARLFVHHHFFFVYPDDDHTIDKIDDKFEYLVKTEHIDATVIDPFNQLDRLDKNTRSDLYISEYCRRRKRFAKKHNLVDITIEHPRTPKDPETAKVQPNMFNINEGLTWGKKMDVLATIHRPRKHEDFMDTQVDFLIDKVKNHRIGGEPALIKMKYQRALNSYEKF